MIEYIKSYLRLRFDERAVTAVEYALIAGLISVVIIGAVTSLGSSLSKTFVTISSAVVDA
jgi:pilus assembly protein Flp/PilA